MFTSANASTWSADQSADLKFTLYRAEFSPEKTVEFGQANVDGSLIYLAADQVIPSGCRVVWEYDAGDGWIAIEPDQTINTGQALNTVDLRARLYGTNLLSPFVAAPPGLLVILWNASGAYVGRNTVLSAFTEIRAYLDIDVPAGATLDLQYSTDGGTVWNNFTSSQLQQSVNNEFDEYLWTVTALSATQMMVRVNMTCDQITAPRARRLRVIAT